MAGKTWQEILNELTVTHGNDLLNFNKLNIVSFCHEMEETSKIAEQYLKSIKASRKDSAVALQKKEDGNKKLLENNYEESLDLYNQSILYAEKNDKSLPLAYANRSLVLEKMGHLTESNNDIDMALICGYPQKKADKLRARKAKVLKKLRTEEECLCLEKNLKVTEAEIISESTSKSAIPKYKLPKVKGGENKDFASASTHLSVYFDKTKGRHVIATEEIEIGEVLFVEKAFAFAVCEQACFNCLQKIIAPIPCEKCLDATYCSLKCRNDSWSSAHIFQCGFGELFKSVGIAHLALQVIITASSNLNDLKNKLKSISEPEYRNGFISLKNNDYESVYNLVHHFEKHEVSDLFGYCMTALLLAKYMKNHTDYFPEKSKDEDLKLLNSIILRHILQMICNGHTVVEAMIRGHKTSVALDKVESSIGTAIYPSISMMNHSCLPSVIISFYKNYSIVQAAKKIKKGEEVFNCYAVDARRMGRTLRQQILREQYFFKCELLKKEDIKLSLENFFRAWKLGKEIFYRFHKDLNYAAVYAVAECSAALKDFERCLSFLKRNVAPMEERFGSFSFESIEELNKLMGVQLAVIHSGETHRDFNEEILMYQLKMQNIIQVFDEYESLLFF